MVGWKLLAIWLIAISSVAARSLFEFEWRDVALSAIVVLVWPAGERLVHRFGMHGPKWMPFYRSHKRHHEQPTMETGLPDWIVIGLYLLVLWIVAMFGTLDWLTVIASMLVGLASYETVHCLVHSKHRPRTWIGWAIRANHLYHHSREKECFGMLFPIGKPVQSDTKMVFKKPSSFQ